MHLAARRFATATLLLIWPALTLAWAPETRVRMVDDAVRLMPRALRGVLETRREQILRGMLTPMTREDQPQHGPPWSDGTLERSVELAARELAESLEQPSSFSIIAERFGKLAHFVADSGYPPGMSDGDPGKRYAHFAEFCAGSADRFPLVFYGHDHPDLAREDYAGYALTVMRRARADDTDLERAYAAAGDPPAASAFDERSVPFALGSLAYSRSVTDIVRVWLTAWAQANGDLGYTPHRNPIQRRP